MTLRYLVTIYTVGPFVTAGEGIGVPGVDVSRAKTADGTHAIPGSHIAGKLREALVRLLMMSDFVTASPSPPNTAAERVSQERKAWQEADRIAGLLFGPNPLVDRPAGQGPRPSRVRVSRFVRVSGGSDGPLLNRIAVDKTRRTARDQMLAFQEAGEHGAEEEWEGSIEFEGFGSSDQGHLDALLWACLQDMRVFANLGCGRGIGFGKIQRIEILRNGNDCVGCQQLDVIKEALKWVCVRPTRNGARSPVRPCDSTLPDLSARLLVHITLKSPLVVADYSPSDNLRETRDDIPGSVLKRALADVWPDPAGDVCPGNFVEDEKFDAIQIRFGFPVADPNEALRPWPYPLTTYAYKGWGWGDAARTRLPADTLLEDLSKKPRSLTVTDQGGGTKRRLFQPDLDALQGWAPGGRGATFRPDHVLISRTAIDPFRQGAAQAQLFSLRAVAEKHVRRCDDGTMVRDASSGRPEFVPQVYLFEVRCPKDTRDKVEKCLAAIRHLGKVIRRGFGEVEVSVQPMERPPSDGLRERLQQFWRETGSNPHRLVPVMLATEALLLPPGRYPVVGQEVKDQYQQVWQKVLARLPGPGNSVRVTVEALYVRHRLRGGVTASGENKGPPVLLTDPGSVFVLRFDGIEDDRLFPLLFNLEQYGAEVPEHVNAVQEAWGCFCPYRASNGYGEVVICHPIHLQTLV